MRIIKRYQREALAARSEYIAVADSDACIHWGECTGKVCFRCPHPPKPANGLSFLCWFGVRPLHYGLPG
ncbi:hypothetical protein DSCA_34260 [Desulfosarcina alkanivorans]|uniref:Uncharacterized protein n=1 Tax=Desulfosarcina alkanivorans TaxID=571177 RepID=A0A5K7YJW7_9BACT|nr:hypothetical protein DSCA_34260 [Desulfosarcina alkanivorans]